MEALRLLGTDKRGSIKDIKRMSRYGITAAKMYIKKQIFSICQTDSQTSAEAALSGVSQQKRSDSSVTRGQKEEILTSRLYKSL